MPKEMLVYTKNKNPKIHRSELRFAAKFMYSLLVGEKIHNKTILWVESKPMNHKEELDGLTIVKDTTQAKPRKFRILLNSKHGRKQQLLALGHELVHVKQFAKGELGNTYTQQNITFTKWKRRFVNESKIHYFDLLWEVEAHGKEYGLYKRYIDFVKKYKLKFKPDTKKA